MNVEFLLATLNPKLNRKVSSDGAKPALFELYMLDQMKNMSKPAFRHVIKAFSGAIYRTLMAFNILRDYENISALVELHMETLRWIVFGVLDIYSIHYRGSAFFETLQGFKRDFSVQTVLAPFPLNIAESNRWISIAHVVILPKLFTTLDNLFSTWRLSTETNMNSNPQDSLKQKSVWVRYIHILKGYVLYVMRRAVRALKLSLAESFPYFKVMYNVVVAANELLYLLNITDFHNPIFYLIGAQLTREQPSPPPPPPTTSIRAAASSSPPLVSPPRVFNMSYTSFIIFLARLVQWYSSNDLSAHNISNLFKKSAFLPPYPAPLDVAQGCVIPPRSTDRCPICREVRVHPCATNSGFVFCYRCILPVVRETQRCPVTDCRCSEQQLIRLFEDET